MNALQVNNIDSLLKELPKEKVQLAINYILWLKQSDDVYSFDELKKIKKARTEKGSISWKKLKENV